MASYKGRVGIVQRVLPRYRAPFFDLLAGQCEGGLGVFAGEARASEAIPLAEKLAVAKWTRAQNLHLLGGPLYFCWQRGLIQWLEGWNPDVLIVEANPRYLSTPAAVRWMKQRRRPVIGWGLGAPLVRSLAAPARIRRRKRFLRQFDALIAYSQRGAAEYKALGFPPERIFVAPNSVSPRPKENPAARRARFDGQPSLLYVGRLQARKRLDSLMRACAELPLQPRLVIVGDGPQRAELEGLGKRIYPAAEFRGALFGSELDKAFNEADLFVLPGTGGLAVQQAMAHGLPVLAAEGDGSQEDMVTAANGWLLGAKAGVPGQVLPKNEAALAAAVAEALSDAARLRNMGAESFRLVQEKFNLETMAEAFISAINEVAG
ncbi:MAG: glycosyltransferase [Anaerolineales bacterium]